MLHTHSVDAENVAPSNHSRHNGLKSTSRKPLGARQPLSAVKQSKAPQPTAAQPKRRALGDITNRREAGASTAKPKLVSKEKASTPVWSLPRDKFGNIEEPHYVPEPVPSVFQPPTLFDEEELAALRRGDDMHETEGSESPDFERLFGGLRKERPAPMLSEEEHDVLEDNFDVFERRIVFSREDFLPIDSDDLVLGNEKQDETA